jgi:hypothetical protein
MKMAETNQPKPLFTVVGQEPDTPQPTPQQYAQAISLIQIGLSTLWQQFVVAVAHAFTLFSCASVFVLYFCTSDPNVHQLIMLGGYSIFILAANYLVIRSRHK